LNTKLTPLVSIIIPTYNHAKFISKALNSIKIQTYDNWEVIIIDNYSTDETHKILDKITDSRIRHLKIDNKGVIAKSRNIGIKEANGEWIAFLDSDDFWTEEKLEVCIRNINENVDFIYHDVESLHHEAKFPFKKKKFTGRQLNKPVLQDLLISTISKGTAIGNSSVIVRKNVLDKIGGISENKNLIASEDYNTWLRIAQVTDNFKYINKKLGYFLIHGDSTQKKKNLSVPQREAVINFMYLFDAQQKLNLEVKLKYMSGCYNASIKNKTEAKKDLMFVFKNSSLTLRIKSLLRIIIVIFI
jgi:glycosyltransferase involved in cell wall biosynthesis